MSRWARSTTKPLRQEGHELSKIKDGKDTKILEDTKRGREFCWVNGQGRGDGEDGKDGGRRQEA